MKKNFIDKKIIFYILFFFLILQMLLISHRVKFDFNKLFNFYVLDVGVHETIDFNDAVKIGNYLKKNNLDFNFEKEFWTKTKDKLDGKATNAGIFKMMLIVNTYPKKINKNSNILISEKYSLKKCNKIFGTQNYYVHECE